MLDGRATDQGDVGVRFERDYLTAPPGAVLGYDHLGLGVDDPAGQSVGRESAEYDRVGGSDPGTRQHGDRQLRDHAEVDRHPVAALDPELRQGVGEPGHLLVELPVREGPGIARLADPVVGHLVADGVEMAVEAVVRDIQGAIGEPLEERRLRIV